MVRQAHHPEQRRRVNLKFQYPMTKTGIAVGPNRFEKLAFPSILPFCTNVDWSFVWNFEFVSLGFV